MSRIYRFFTGALAESDLDEKEVVLSGRCEGAIFYQLVKVLRVKPEDEVVLLTGKGSPPFFEFRFNVGSANKHEVRLVFKSKKENLNEPAFGLELVLCLPNKPDKLAMILQKSVELGATRITLVNGEFSQMKHELRPDRLEKIMLEAAEQSERAVAATLEIKGSLCDYLRDAASGSENLLVAMEREDAGFLPDVLRGISEDVGILIGPEGGFSAAEKDAIHAAGLRCYSLGKRILRMETAVILSLGMAAMRPAQ